MVGVQRQAGLSHLEFSVMLAVLALIWLAALNRLHEVQEMGEKTAVEMTIRNIQSGLRLEMSERIMTKHESSIVEMAGSNPVNWLEKKPDNYLGEFPGIPDRFSSGSWYFDTSRHEISYRPALQHNLECRQCEKIGGDIILSWRIARAANPMFGRGDRVGVVATAIYRWF